MRFFIYRICCLLFIIAFTACQANDDSIENDDGIESVAGTEWQVSFLGEKFVCTFLTESTVQLSDQGISDSDELILGTIGIGTSVGNYKQEGQSISFLDGNIYIYHALPLGIQDVGKTYLTRYYYRFIDASISGEVLNVRTCIVQTHNNINWTLTHIPPGYIENYEFDESTLTDDDIEILSFSKIMQ